MNTTEQAAAAKCILRFRSTKEPSILAVWARRKTTGKYEQIGTCLSAAKQAIRDGNWYLIKLARASA